MLLFQIGSADARLLPEQAWEPCRNAYSIYNLPVGTTASCVQDEHLQFRPRRFLAGGHIQTIASFLLPRRFAVPPPEQRLVVVEPGIRILCHCHWQPDKRAALTVIAVHGLEGSSESKY